MCELHFVNHIHDQLVGVAVKYPVLPLQLANSLMAIQTSEEKLAKGLAVKDIPLTCSGKIRHLHSISSLKV